VKLTIIDVPKSEWPRAGRAALQFLKENPDKQDILYGRSILDEVALFIKRTKDGVTVKGIEM
jgi:hypothetical protein